jgi:hypothetical protein
MLLLATNYIPLNVLILCIVVKVVVMLLLATNYIPVYVLLYYVLLLRWWLCCCWLPTTSLFMF